VVLGSNNRTLASLEPNFSSKSIKEGRLERKKLSHRGKSFRPLGGLDDKLRSAPDGGTKKTVRRRRMEKGKKGGGGERPETPL